MGRTFSLFLGRDVYRRGRDSRCASNGRRLSIMDAGFMQVNRAAALEKVHHRVSPTITMIRREVFSRSAERWQREGGREGDG